MAADPGRGSYINNAERDDYISTTIKEKAKDYCDTLVKDFRTCAQDRRISVAWACRKQHKAMKRCLDQYYRIVDVEKIKREANVKKDKGLL